MNPRSPQIADSKGPLAMVTRMSGSPAFTSVTKQIIFPSLLPVAIRLSCADTEAF